MQQPVNGRVGNGHGTQAGGEAALEDSREQMRDALGVPPATAGADPDSEFPRSVVMRALADPERRWLWAAGIAAAVVIIPRLLPVRNIAPLIAAYSAYRSIPRAEAVRDELQRGRYDDLDDDRGV